MRDRYTAALLDALAHGHGGSPQGADGLPLRRIHPGIDDRALFGGLDLAATLASGHPVRGAGILDAPCILVLTMAERCPPGLAARLAAALDRPGFCLIALDEGATPDEVLPPALTDRLALFVDLEGIGWSQTAPIAPIVPIAPDARPTAPAAPDLPPRARAPQDDPAIDALGDLARAATALGVASLRAPSLALAAARAAAHLDGRACPNADDTALAGAMVYAHRAAPPAEAQEAAPPPPPPADDPPPPDQPDSGADDQSQPDQIPEEMIVEAALAALPPELLAQLAAGRAARTARGATGSGSAIKGNRRGRPLPSRPGRLGSGARIDIVGTLRAAAPWQPIRRALQPDRAAFGLLIRPSDIRLRRFQETSDRVLVFAVDASGSAAMSRLAEAKGAVELMLAQAYARRDHVALIAFRGTRAELLLPPTRSLVQTKRRLASLPGGGATPLALGLGMAADVAEMARARGLSPALAILTDGRGNIDLNGQPGRAQAAEDAARMARRIAVTGVPAVIIDTAPRPGPALAILARDMGATCLALPRADAKRLSAALGAALGDGG